MAEKSAELKKKYFFIPEDNLDQAIVISNIGIVSCRDLAYVMSIISGNGLIFKEAIFSGQAAYCANPAGSELFKETKNNSKDHNSSFSQGSTPGDESGILDETSDN